MSSPTSAHTLDALIEESAAHPAFKDDLRAYAAFQPADRVVVTGYAPRLKVLRVLTQLLAAEPALAVEHVRVRGSSGCADFRGTVSVAVDGVERTWDFVWDCRWRAQQAGLVDAIGFPDQARAAREFGWRCFSVWTERPRG